MSTRMLAAKAGISNGSAFYVVTALIEKGLVKIENFKNHPRKKQYIYLLTPRGIREKSVLTHNFIAYKRQEFIELQAEIKALETEAGISDDTTCVKEEEKSHDNT